VKFSLAILLSILAHALLALGIGCGAWGLFGNDALTLAQLDLSSVELSFAEKEDDSAAAAPSLASAASDPVPETKPVEETPPPELEAPKDLPPDPEAPTLPEPEEERKPLETPEPKKIEETQETKETEETRKTEEAPRPASVATAAAAPRQARVDAPVRPKKAIKPDYPKGARQRGEQGNVVLEILVNEAGRVEGVKVVTSSGFSELDEAAIRAARAARFTPAKRGRTPVASSARLTLEFRLKQ
jgi:periplasmic protein TonB